MEGGQYREADGILNMDELFIFLGFAIFLWAQFKLRQLRREQKQRRIELERRMALQDEWLNRFEEPTTNERPSYPPLTELPPGMVRIKEPPELGITVIRRKHNPKPPSITPGEAWF